MLRGNREEEKEREKRQKKKSLRCFDGRNRKGIRVSQFGVDPTSEKGDVPLNLIKL
ncbi:hypothetical protein YC2023_032061 [Brassica napus]